MFSLASRCPVRATVAFPSIFRSAGCLVDSTHTNIASSRPILSSLTSPLTCGVSYRSFCTSSICFAGLFYPCSFCLQTGFENTRSHGTDGQRNRVLPQRRLRLHGTVTAFKHRRGYGFVLAEGVVPLSKKPVYTSLSALQPKAATASNPHNLEDATACTGGMGEKDGGVDAATAAAAAEEEALLHKTYFFTRAALNGGFYVTEGERVSFYVDGVDPNQGTLRHLGAPALHSTTGSSGATAAALSEEFSLDPTTAETNSAADSASSHKVCATKIQLYDLRTHTELPVRPITLYGKIVEWDDVKGRGVVAELDTERQYHDDGPRFPVSIEDMDLGAGTRMSAGRYVRFCLEPASASKVTGAEGVGEVDEDGEAAATTAAGAVSAGEGGAAQLVAQRVIVDFLLERRRGAFGRPLVPATATPGTVSDQTRFHGLVREIRNNRFGFIIDDLSGESIFFHAVNARVGVKVGDRVTYLLREMTEGKHKGKKACFDVKCAAGDGAVRRGSSPTSTLEVDVGTSSVEEDEEEMDLLGETYGAAAKHALAAETHNAGGNDKATTMGKKAAAPKSRPSKELEFESL